MKKKYLLVYMSMLLISCGFFQETYTSEDAAGVRIVHNNRSSWGDGEKISLEYVRKIGLLSGEDENYIFSEPVDAAGDSEGNIYILDKGKHRVQKFDPSGRYLLTIGRQGTEDGEFIKPDMIEITGSDEVYVCKFLRNVQRFSSTGEFLSDFESPVNEREFKVLSDGSIIIRNVIQGSDQFLLSKISREYALMNKFGEAVTDEDVKKTVNQNLLYFDTDSKDNVYAVFRHQNRIDKYSTDGDLKVQSDRKLNYEIEYTYTDDHKNLVGVPFDYAQHDFTTVSTGIAVDINDRVWVSTYRTHASKRPWEKLEFEVFSNEGILLTKIPFPERVFGKFRISGDKMFCIDDDNKCVYIYRIVERE